MEQSITRLQRIMDTEPLPPLLPTTTNTSLISSGSEGTGVGVSSRCIRHAERWVMVRGILQIIQLGRTGNSGRISGRFFIQGNQIQVFLVCGGVENCTILCTIRVTINFLICKTIVNLRGTPTHLIRGLGPTLMRITQYWNKFPAYIFKPMLEKA